MISKSKKIDLGNKLNTLRKRVEGLTNENFHTEARLELATITDDNELVADLKAIKEEGDKWMTMELCEKRLSLDSKLKDALVSKFGLDVATLLLLSL